MAADKRMSEDTLLLLHIIHKDNPTLSGGNWPAISAKMGLPADRLRKRFAAMRKEFMEMGDDTTHEALAPRKRGRPAKNSKSDANSDAKPKAKRAKTASGNKAAAKSNGNESGDSDDSDASEIPVAAAGKKSNKIKVTKEDADAAHMAPASDEDEA